MTRRLLSATLLWVLGFCATASAGPITFTFDSTPTNPLLDNANSASIKTYMNKVLLAELGIGNTVTTLAGAKVEANNSYTGDNHVVGPVIGANTKATSLTLGNSDNALAQGTPLGLPHGRAGDGYIYNSAALMFSMVFLMPTYKINQVSFDYQIFPNGSCGNPANLGTPGDPDAGGGNCNVWPDFTLKAYNATGTLVKEWKQISQDPQEPGYVGYTRSPISGTNPAYKEKAPQLLSMSGIIAFTEPVTKLEFYDWPERVGIDNLVLNPTPEPATLLLMGAGAGILGLGRRRLRGSGIPPDAV